MSTVAAALVAAGLRLAVSHAEFSVRGPHRADFARWGAYADGAPPGFSGGFREESCHACHFHGTLNDTAGALTVDGVPPDVTPNQRYTLTIALSREGMRRAGFQLAARYKDNGAQAGTLLISSSDSRRVKVENQGGVLYASHNKSGSENITGGTVRWSVDWIAPLGSRAIVINVAANAADGDDRVDGDFIYTAAIEAAPPRLP